MKGDLTNCDSRKLDENKIQKNPTPIVKIEKVEMLIQKKDSALFGIRMYDADDKVIFTTGKWIEDKSYRSNKVWGELVEFKLKKDERIIQIRSHDSGYGNAIHRNV